MTRGSTRDSTSNLALHRVEIKVSNLRISAIFYDGFLKWLGYARVLHEKAIVGWRKGPSRIFVVQCARKYFRNRFHRKNVGLNHIAFYAPTRQTIDKFYQNYLLPKRIHVLYGGVKEWPEYEGGNYTIYWEDPDRIKLELVKDGVAVFAWRGLT